MSGGLPVLKKKLQNNGVDSLLYTYSDAQGSLIALTDKDGSLLTKTVNGTSVEIGRFAYDPWGKRREHERGGFMILILLNSSVLTRMCKLWVTG